jgi:uncharacterized protein YhdP
VIASLKHRMEDKAHKDRLKKIEKGATTRLFLLLSFSCIYRRDTYGYFSIHLDIIWMVWLDYW